MNRKILLGCALLATLGIAGAPWIKSVFEGEAAANAATEVNADRDLMMGMGAAKDDLTIPGSSSVSSSMQPSSGQPNTLGALAEGRQSAPNNSDETEGELGGLLTAIEGLRQGFQGGDSVDFSDFDGSRQVHESEQDAADVDRAALLDRYPLSSLAIGPERSFAQLGGELVSTGSLLSDGRTRVRRITSKGVELLVGDDGIWVPLPPMRHLPGQTNLLDAQMDASSSSASDLEPDSSPSL